MFWRVIGNKLTGNADTSETKIINTIDFTQLNNLFFRFIADSSTTMVSDSVIQWNDVSANNLNVSQPNTSMRPLLISDEPILNNHSYLYFDGNNDFLQSTSFDLPQPLNYFIIFNEKGIPIDYMDGGSVAKHLLRNSSSKYGFYSGSSYVVSTTTVDTNKFIILNVELNNGNANLFINNLSSINN